MKRQQLIIAGLGLMSVVLLSSVACSPVKSAETVAPAAGELDQVPLTSSTVAPTPEATPGSSCACPSAEMVATCQSQAERILASTVRIEFHGPGGGIGHATVVGGRYLITHNHYPTSGAALSRGGDGLLEAISVYKSNNDVILLKAPLAYFSVALIAPEALVLDFHEYSGVGFFDSLGVPSLESVPLSDLDIQPGSEVAQIDWDMTTTRVIWVRVTSVHAEGEAPFIELDSFVEQGASGGGVFYNGIHIANNWSRNTEWHGETGEVLRQFSVAALNTASITPLVAVAPALASSVTN